MSEPISPLNSPLKPEHKAQVFSVYSEPLHFAQLFNRHYETLITSYKNQES